MKRAQKKGLGAPSPAATAGTLGSTGQPRRDRVTQGVFARLCSRVPLLARNPPALAQLTQIVYGSLSALRASEDRSAELCERALTEAGCTHCNWTQKNHCEACGTDFTKTTSKVGYPAFVPSFDAHLLHVDVCMLCSERCIDKLMASREQKEAQATSADAAAENNANSTGMKRLTRGAADPHLSPFSLIFHVAAYVAILYTLFLANYSVEAVPYFLTAWNLLGNLALYGLWILNMMFSWSAGGGVSSVYRLRQALSYLFAVNCVLCVGMTTIFWALFWANPGGIKTVGDPTTPLEEQLKHSMPILLMAVELYSFPHVKVNRLAERVLCILVPSLFLVSSYHKRFYSSFQAWPYPFFNALTTPAHFGIFVLAVFAILFALTAAFQKVRDRVWASYVVPKHLQMAD